MKTKEDKDSIKKSGGQDMKLKSSGEKQNNNHFSETKGKLPIQTDWNNEEKGYAEERYKPEDDVLRFVKETPFNIRKVPNGYVILIGMELVSGRMFETQEKAEKYIRSKPWELITTTACIMAGDMVGLTNKKDREKFNKEAEEAQKGGVNMEN